MSFHEGIIYFIIKIIWIFAKYDLFRNPQESSRIDHIIDSASRKAEASFMVI
jgi:hypothetical protein